MSSAFLSSYWFVLAVASAFVFGLAGLFMKASQARSGSTPHLLVGLYVAGASLFVLHTTLAGDWTSWSIWLLLGGLLVGSGSAWGNDLFMRALAYGPAALTSPVTNMNILLVVLFGTIYFHEPLNGWQLLAIAGLAAAVFLLSWKPQRTNAEPTKPLPKIWFMLVGAAVVLFALRNGGLKWTQSWHLPNDAVLAVAYVWSLIWFFPPILKRTQSPATKVSARIGWLWGLAAGVCSYGGMQLYAMALERGMASIVSPIFATNSMIIAFGSMIFFKERLSKLQWLAFVLMIGGLILIRWHS